MAAALRALPLARWASRFVAGGVALTGRLETTLDLDLDGTAVPLQPGPIRVEVDFEGGEHPQISEIRIDGSVHPHGPEAADGLATLLDVLHDAGVDARAWTDTDLVVKVGHGIQAHVHAGGAVTLRAVAVGPPDMPRLVEALEVRVDGSGVRISHERARWLTVLARVRIHRAALHPDGSVHLEGGGRSLLDQAVGKGLSTASRRLSDLVRRSPRFARVRAFLHPAYSK